MLVYVTNVLFVGFSPFAREKQTIANIEISLFYIFIEILYGGNTDLSSGSVHAELYYTTYGNYVLIHHI